MTIKRQTTPVVDETQDDVFVEGPARYVGLLGRVGRALKPLSTQVRYLGYTSDLGEAFRPVVSPTLVKV
jgi:fission process protein 1